MPPLTDGAEAMPVRSAHDETPRDASPGGLASLLPLLVCLRCRADALRLLAAESVVVCQDCATRYPVFRCGESLIPWLFENPNRTLLQWKARYHGFLHSNSVDLERLRSARTSNGNRPKTNARIRRLLHAREHYRRQVVDLLRPFNLDAIDWPADGTAILEDKLPGNQGLSSYISNVFRDWSWNNGESEEVFDAVARVTDADPRPSIGKVLVLGSGACRLAYDVHRRYQPETTVNVDINPLLLHIGMRVAKGDPVDLYEFPIAPRTGSDSAVLQTCTAPVALRDDRFHGVAADALALPFGGSVVDTIMTPWLIDIIPYDLRTFLPFLNHCLVEGGLWLNTGSLAFFHRDASWCYEEDELAELVEESGFEILSRERRTVSYLKSPHSAHGRTEEILSFCARKVADVALPERPHYLPQWLIDTSVPVPAGNEIELRSSNHLLTAQILGLIDGKKTVNQIARKVARQYGLGLAETCHAVRQVLIGIWEEAGQKERSRQP